MQQQLWKLSPSYQGFGTAAGMPWNERGWKLIRQKTRHSIKNFLTSNCEVRMTGRDYWGKKIREENSNFDCDVCLKSLESLHIYSPVCFYHLSLHHTYTLCIMPGGLQTSWMTLIKQTCIRVVQSWNQDITACSQTSSAGTSWKSSEILVFTVHIKILIAHHNYGYAKDKAVFCPSAWIRLNEINHFRSI